MSAAENPLKLAEHVVRRDQVVSERSTGGRGLASMPSRYAAAIGGTARSAARCPLVARG
jgi:hypothetical protein